MSAKFMLDELCAPVMEMLAMRFAARVIDYYMGNYELEEGEIVDCELTQDELRGLAERIILSDNSSNELPVVDSMQTYYDCDEESEVGFG
jgi:hypothetical protein